MSGPTRLWSAVAALAVMVAGCSSTITGMAVKAPGAGSTGGDGVDIALLDTGNYPITARPALGVAGSVDEGSNVEGRRIAGNVVGPWEADPLLTQAEQLNTLVIRGPDALNELIGKPVGDGIVEHHYITGFASARHNGAGSYKGLANYVLRFNSPADAAAAAHDMASKSAALTVGDTAVGTQPFSIPRYPGTAAVTYRWPAAIPSTRGDVPLAVLAFTAHGPYVLCQNADDLNPDRAAQLIATTLDLQQPLIDKFQPTPLDQLPQLPRDPDGLLARTLPESAGYHTVNDGVYDPHGALHVEPGDPVHLQALFGSVGLQRAVETSEVRIYQTPEVESANRVVADYAKSDDPAGPGITGMPKARCFTEALGQWCVAPAERYVFVVQAAHETELHQKMAAQYRMLTGK